MKKVTFCDFSALLIFETILKLKFQQNNCSAKQFIKKCNFLINFSNMYNFLSFSIGTSVFYCQHGSRFF